MARGTIQVKGIDKLVRKLKRNANLTDVKNVVKLNGAEMQRKAQRYAPVDTGNLKRGITLTSQHDGLTAKVESTANYAPFQEYGTRFQPGKPHIRPSYFEQRIRFINDMRRLMK